jgi:hypothetical protein
VGHVVALSGRAQWHSAARYALFTFFGGAKYRICQYCCSIWDALASRMLGTSTSLGYAMLLLHFLKLHEWTQLTLQQVPSNNLLQMPSAASMTSLPILSAASISTRTTSHVELGPPLVQIASGSMRPRTKVTGRITRTADRLT